MTFGELAGVVEAARDVERVLERLVAVRRRRHADLARRHLLALLLQRLDDVLRREAARLHLLRIEPDAHRILSGAEHVTLPTPGRRASSSFSLMVA